MGSISAGVNADLVVLGEFFLDLIFYKLSGVPKLGEEVKTEHFAESPGGGVATTALVASGLGTSTAVVTRIGNDARRNQSWQKLLRSGISIAACEFSPRFPTARTVCVAYNADRMMITHDAINRRLHTLLRRPTVLRQLHKAKHVHLACALYPLQAWSTALRRVRSQSLTLSADIGWNPDILQSARLPALLREFDFVFPNEIEAQTMTGENSVERAAKKLARWVGLPVVKLGQDGCIAVKNGKLLRVKSIRVHVVDATGAGDAFNGGFLHGFLSGWGLEDCLRAGNICGAMATTCPGGSSALLSRRELLRAMKRI